MVNRRKKRARNLSDADIKEIVEILDGWTTKDLSWQRLVDEVSRRTFRTYTRQALFKKERIRIAFETTKKRFPATKNTPSRNVSPEVQSLLDCKARLEAKIERLEAENNRLLEQLVVLSRNAYARGLSAEDLNQPLPPVNRGQTEDASSLKIYKNKKRQK